MFKRILAALMAASLCVSLAACGSGGDTGTGAADPAPASSADEGGAASEADPGGGTSSGDKVHVSYWNQLSGGDGDIMKAMVDKYNSEDNAAEIEMTILQSEEYYSKLITAMATNDAPDVAVSHMFALQEFVTEEYLYPLDDVASSEGLNWSEFTDRLQAGIQFDGVNYAVPLDTHVFLMHFNIDILTEMGLMDEDNRPTFDVGDESFLEYFRQVKEQLGPDMMPISGTSQNELPMYLWWTLYTQQGGQIISEDGATATLDNAENLRALNFIHQLNEEELWPKNQKNGAEIFTSFNAAATFNGNWGIPIFEKTDGLNFISLPFPQIFDQKSVYADSHTLVAPVQRQDDDVKLAAVMNFMNWMADNTIMWADAGHIPSKTAIVDSDAFKALPYRSEYAESANWATFYPKSTTITAMRASFIRIFASMISGEYTPEQAAELMQEDMQRLLDEADY